MVAFLLANLFIVEGVRSLRHVEFASRSRHAAGAIFLTKAGKRRFICSGTLFAHTENGDGLFLTARHCVYEDANPEEGTEAGLLGNEEVSFSDNEAGPFYTAIPYKVSATDDVAILEIVNGRGLPTVRLGDENLTVPGSTLTNYTYGLDFGKMGVELKSVAPIFNHFPNDMLSTYPVWSHSMPVIGLAIPGSSGSGLFDPKQQSIVGIIVGGGPRLGTLVIAIPVSRAWKLLSDPTGQDITPKAAPASLTIPADVFTSQFGKDHAFKIPSQPGDLQFTHGGYVFKVNTFGVGLSPKFYFDVPVYIGAMTPGQYRLYTTAKEGYSVDTILVSKAV
jgi:trypsin-like peptidase